jgi:hypothetical protein
MLICARALAYKHTTLGIKKASIRIMRGKVGSYPAAMGAGCTLECAKVKYWYYTIEMAAVLPGGQRQYAGGYSSYRGMSGYGGSTQMHNILVAIAGHAADWNAGS